ncbi:FUSC family protein [Oceanobacillus arenosus]|uniref:FUSC family protein n=1 Tax=Oceanobacillus arenosus TaxID=1229153 RepID=A0A3D8PQU6_9BACI|nr:FUSC family protein [Oceanobacillus arenosus]RDW17549.1 FUSC family protein [Oceanobacillus arenosus]
MKEILQDQKETSSRKSPSIIKQALQVNSKPFPWVKAFCAGLAAALPVMIGLLLGNFQYGLIATLGGFSYLYVFNTPYAQRAKKIFLVVLGMTLVTVLGTLAAPYPLAVAILMGLIGAAAIFIFGALKIAGPSAIFFVLVFLMTSGMPVNPDEALLRGGLVFLGGALSWVIAMLGWFADPHGPETGVVKRVYMELASLIDSVGTEGFREHKHKVMSVLNESEATLTAGHIPWRTTDFFNRLYVMNDHANMMFHFIVENFSDQKEKLPREIGSSVRLLAQSLEKKKQPPKMPDRILQPEELSLPSKQLLEKIYNADAVLNEPTTKINKVIRISKPSLKMVFMGAFDKNSIVFLTALRFGLVTMAAAIFAFELEFERSYWVPLSCVAVMAGSTVIATYHRSIQRSIGTIVGILIASVILAFHPSGLMVAVFILLLTFITELFIVKNYGLAALFFTPNALLMAESTSQEIFNFTYFAQARLIDVIIGTAIGLVGVLLIGRTSASSRIPHMMGKTIRSQAQFLHVLFSNQGEDFDASNSRERSKMKTNLSNLKTLYNTASGELPVNRKALEYYWPVVFSMGELEYLMDECAKDSQKRPELSDDKLAQLLLAFETMANAANRKRAPKRIEIPEINEYPTIRNEIIHLQDELHRYA